MNKIKVTKKYQQFLQRPATIEDVKSYKHAMITSSPQEIFEHNAQVEAKKKAKHLARIQRNQLQ